MKPVSLPVDAVLPELCAELRAHGSVVLLAPPGAGKTTRVPGALVDLGLAPRQVLILEPRRLAARLAAERIAAERGGRLGEEVGYQIRFLNKTSKRTRIIFLTEGILTRRMLTDPFLDGVDAVVLDEFHERSVHADLAIAFLREAQETVRPDLKILVMSATLDPAPVARFLGDAPVIESQGRSFPVTAHWTRERDERRVTDRVVSGVRRALREQPGASVLAFLPGAREIQQAEAELKRYLPGDVDLCPLYGELDEKRQNRAVAPSERQRVVLATNIAESSLTIPGITVVVDGGEQKRMRHDPARGVDRLERVRISRRSLLQRAGRAGRTAPGHAYRTWTEREEQHVLEEDPAELLRVDLAPVLMSVLKWSPSDPRAFRWFEAPSETAILLGLAQLRELGLLSQEGWQLTEAGEKVAQLPLHPRLGRLLLSAHEAGCLEEGAQLAALASERDILTSSFRRALEDAVDHSDLGYRSHLLLHAAGGDSGLDRAAAAACMQTARRLKSLAGVWGRPGARAKQVERALRFAVFSAFRDRVGMRVDGGRIRMLGGQQLRLAKESVVKQAKFLVAIEITDTGHGAKNGALIRIASAVDEAWLPTTERKLARFDGVRQAAIGFREICFGDLVLRSSPDPKIPLDLLSACLKEAAEADLDHALPLTDALMNWLQRLRFLREAVPERGLPELGPEDRRRLLPDLCHGKRRFKELADLDLRVYFEAELGAEAGYLHKEAPEALRVPSGSLKKLRYPPEGPPVLAVRLQEVFGLMESPRVAEGRVPVKMELLAPNQRPVQVTQDLASFWKNTYQEVRKELRRRYPKHQWPEDPADGIPSARVRRKLPGAGR